MRTPAPKAIMSPSGRNPIGRRRARRLPSRSDEAAINPQANASPIETPYVHDGSMSVLDGHIDLPVLSSYESPTHYETMPWYRLGSWSLFTRLPRSLILGNSASEVAPSSGPQA